MADLEIWLNAFSCVRPTDEFAADLGHQVISKLRESRTRDRDDSDPIFKITVEITAS